MLTVDYTIAVDEAQARQVAQTLQEASPDTVATTLQQSFQEAGVGDQYGELGVVGLAVTNVPAVVGTTQTAGAGEGNESGKDQVVSAAVAAVLASLGILLCCGCFCVCCVCQGVRAEEATVTSGKPVEEVPPIPTAKDLEESQQDGNGVATKTTFEVDVDRHPDVDKAETNVGEDGAVQPVDVAGARESLQRIMDDVDPPLDSPASSAATRARRWLTFAPDEQRPQSSGARASAIDSPPTRSWLDGGAPGPRAEFVVLAVNPGEQAPSGTQPSSSSRGSQKSVQDWLTGGQSTGSTYGWSGQAVVEDVIRAPRISMSGGSWTPASQDAQEQLQSRVAVSLQVRCETPRDASNWTVTPRDVPNENLWL